MLTSLALIGLLGVLLVLGQAVWVKRRTPRLPEAVGPRMGVVGPAPHLRLMVIGESPAAGVGVEHQHQALAGQIANALDALHARGCHWCVAARSGLRAAELSQLVADAPSGFDAVVVVLGVNDAKDFRSRRRFRSELENLATLLRQRHPEARVLWCGIPPLDRFPALPQPLAALLGWRSRQLDRELALISTRNTRDLHLPIRVQSDDFARDGFHPGRQGYRLWGEAVASILVSNETEALA